MNRRSHIFRTQKFAYPGVENELFFVQMTRSQVATNWHPAAALNPLTLAMTGTGDWIISSINSVAFSKTCRCSCCPLSMENSFKLCPAENTEPVADKTIHRRSSFCLLRRKFVNNSDIISNDKAFLSKPIPVNYWLAVSQLHCHLFRIIHLLDDLPIFWAIQYDVTNAIRFLDKRQFCRQFGGYRWKSAQNVCLISRKI